MSIAEKLIAVAENIPKVYEAGYKEGYEAGQGSGGDDYEAGKNDFGLKMVFSGESLAINNVHPIEHIVKANLASKNLFQAVNQNIRIDPTKTYFLSSGKSETMTRITFNVYDIEGNRVTKNVTIYGFYYSEAMGRWTLGSNASNLWIPMNFTGADRNKIAYIRFLDAYPNMQFEQRSGATPYTPYIADFSNIKLIVNETDTYSSDENGIVEDMKSVSPTMNISADTEGVIINAECFLDPAAIVNQLGTAILNLGGTI